LIEIKHTDDLKRNGDKYKTKFAVAENYAHEQGWEFCFKSEKDIRIPRLKNIKFLREYRNIDVDESERRQLIDILWEI